VKFEGEGKTEQEDGGRLHDNRVVKVRGTLVNWPHFTFLLETCDSAGINPSPVFTIKQHTRIVARPVGSGSPVRPGENEELYWNSSRIRFAMGPCK
jgi:hypothetical protein